jgi:hypothetical protein
MASSATMRQRLSVKRKEFNLMKKFLPIIFGAILGFIATQFSLPKAIAFLCVSQFFLVGWLLYQAYKPPGAITLCPERELLDEAGRNVKLLRQAGFLATPKMDINGATIVGLNHPDFSLVGYVFQTNTVPAKVSFNFASRVAGTMASLSTSQGPTLLATPKGYFEQTFPGASIEVLLEEHKRAMAFLAEKGVKFDQIGQDDLEPDTLNQWQAAANEARLSLFKKSPVSSIILGFVRALGGPNPRKRRIEEQPDVIAQFGL